MTNEKNLNNENNSTKETPTVNTDAVDKTTQVTEVQENSGLLNSLRAKQIGLTVLALLFVGGALFSVLRPGTALELLEKVGIETSESVAVVNGEKIYADELKARILQQEPVYESQGMDLSDPETAAEAESQTLEVMVREKVVLQEAEKQGITVSEEEIDEQYKQTREQFDSEGEFQAQLSAYSFTKESLRENLSEQLLIEKYLKNNVNEDGINVSEEEVVNFYDEYKDSIEDVDSLDALRGDIEQHLRQQKTDQEISRIVQELRDNAEVEILL